MERPAAPGGHGHRLNTRPATIDPTISACRGREPCREVLARLEAVELARRSGIAESNPEAITRLLDRARTIADAHRAI
jgi:hypothetical protein